MKNRTILLIGVILISYSANCLAQSMYEDTIFKHKDLLYQQNTIEVKKIVYMSDKMILAGNTVNSKSQKGDYVVGDGSHIEFYSGERIELKGGFQTMPHSYFHADVIKKALTDDMNSGINIYPNPVQNQLNITLLLPMNEQVSFIVTNIIGQEVINTTKDLPEGNQIQTLSTHDFMPGMYLITVKTKEVQKQIKFVKN